MDGQYWKGDRTISTNEWLLASDFWQFLEPWQWHGRWYEYEIFVASCTGNIYDLENERWLLGYMIDHVGIYGSRVAEGLSAFNVGLVYSYFLYLYMVLHYLALMYYALTLLCQERRNKDVQSNQSISVPWYHSFMHYMFLDCYQNDYFLSYK